MAKYHKYSDDQGYYIRHSFRSGNKLVHVTFQVSHEGQEKLEIKGIREGDTIPKQLLFELEKEDLIYTNKSGATSEYYDESTIEAFDFPDLTEEASGWFINRLESYPGASTSMKWGKTEDGRDQATFTVENLPRHYAEQLLRVARIFDGTDFFRDLDKSYNTQRSKYILAKKDTKDN